MLLRASVAHGYKGKGDGGGSLGLLALLRGRILHNARCGFAPGAGAPNATFPIKVSPVVVALLLSVGLSGKAVAESVAQYLRIKLKPSNFSYNPCFSLCPKQTFSEC